jgi:hypothetical protein
VLYALSALPRKCRCRRGGQGRLSRKAGGIQSWKYAIFVLNPFLKGLCQHLEVDPKKNKIFTIAEDFSKEC